MADVGSVTGLLGQYAEELDRLSKEKAKVEAELERPAAEYDARYDAFVARLWARYEAGEIRSFPGEDVRRALARQEMDPEMLVRRDRLVAARGRKMRRVADLGAIIDAQRSVLSALKLEVDATSYK